MTSADNDTVAKVFDYRVLRLLMGVIALSFPFIVSNLAPGKLDSISAAYYTESRDLFVGMLFIVGSFLWAYNGHSYKDIPIKEATASRVASVAAIMVALFPTSRPMTCDQCLSIVVPVVPFTKLTPVIHYSAALILFSMLTYFCLLIFRRKTKKQAGKRGLRGKIYFVCGYGMVACMLVLGLEAANLMPDFTQDWRLFFFAEALTLILFGVAWITSGKLIPMLVDKDDPTRLGAPKIS